MRGQILLGLIVGAATFAGLIVLGWTVDPRFIQFAVLLAVVAGLLELLPIIGPIIADDPDAARRPDYIAIRSWPCLES